MSEPSALPWDRIELRGLRVTARVGVLPIEREQAQPLEADLDVVTAQLGRGEKLVRPVRSAPDM